MQGPCQGGELGKESDRDAFGVLQVQLAKIGEAQKEGTVKSGKLPLALGEETLLDRAHGGMVTFTLPGKKS